MDTRASKTVPTTTQLGNDQNNPISLLVFAEIHRHNILLEKTRYYGAPLGYVQAGKSPHKLQGMRGCLYGVSLLALLEGSLFFVLPQTPQFASAAMRERRIIHAGEEKAAQYSESRGDAPACACHALPME